MEQKWRKLNGVRVQQPIVDEIRQVVIREKNEGHQLKVYIGTDSQVKGKQTEFATAIVFLRKGRGGFMYFLPEITQQKMSVKQRILEIHADINTNPNFKSNDALKEAIG